MHKDWTERNKMVSIPADAMVVYTEYTQGIYQKTNTSETNK